LEFERLDVWRRAVLFANDVIDLVESFDSDRKHFRLIEQLEAASTSVSMNIAEGKGRNSKKEFVQFLYYSRGSLFEVITLLEIIKMRKWITEEQFMKIKIDAIEISKMLIGLIKHLSQNHYD
jgi:four helix bundle protein